MSTETEIRTKLTTALRAIITRTYSGMPDNCQNPCCNVSVDAEHGNNFDADVVKYAITIDVFANTLSELLAFKTSIITALSRSANYQSCIIKSTKCTFDGTEHRLIMILSVID